MILGFKPQFVEPILNDIKIHTIREDKLNRWKAGNAIQFATGVRTRFYKQFHSGECKSVQSILIELSLKDGLKIYVYDKEGMGRELSVREKIQLAKNDGFSCYSDFIDWFYPLIKDEPKMLKLIHWTDFRY